MNVTLYRTQILLNTYCVCAIIFTTLILSACSTAKKSADIEGDVYTGKETIEYAIRYGTASPLNKYIDELRRILDKTLDTDDKGPKRQMRLDFLEFCNGNIFIRTLFQLFTAYLNGGGSRGSDRRFHFEQYENQLHLVSVAGGNVFILFAQLLLNMYSMSVIDQIKAPIKTEMDSFESKFKASMASKAPLLDKITNYIVIFKRFGNIYKF